MPGGPFVFKLWLWPDGTRRRERPPRVRVCTGRRRKGCENVGYESKAFPGGKCPKCGGRPGRVASALDLM